MGSNPGSAPYRFPGHFRHKTQKWFLANDSKGITQSLPKPEPVEEKNLPDAIPIPGQDQRRPSPAPKTTANAAKRAKPETGGS